MAEEKVKLTVRLPAELHLALKERAVEYHVSLNQALVDALTAELVASAREETDVEKFDRMMRETGLRADTEWMTELIEELTGGEPLPTLKRCVNGCRECRSATGSSRIEGHADASLLSGCQRLRQALLSRAR